MHAGLMPLLDEEVKLPRGSNAAWLSKCRQHNADHPALVGAAGTFTVPVTPNMLRCSCIELLQALHFGIMFH
jgi:hypothetical protein